MKRLILILLLTMLLLFLTSTVVYADTLSQDGGAEADLNLERAIGTLGLYAALMAVLAVGAEIVVDTVRPVFGLQRKTTTAEALKKLNSWLPAAAKDLGLSEEAQTRINRALEQLEEVTKGFEDKAAEAKRIIEGEWPNLLKDLAIEEVDKVLDHHWAAIDKKLADPPVGLSPAQREDAKTVLRRVLGEIRGIDAEIPNQLALFNSVMAEVAELRNQVQGPARKTWRQVRNALIKVGSSERFKNSPLRHLFFLPAYVEYAWARFWGKVVVEAGEKLEDAIKKLGEAQSKTVTNVQEAARWLLEEDSKHSQEEHNRVTWLRIMSAAIGVVLAAALQIDSLQLLEPVLQSTAGVFKTAAGEWATIDQLIGPVQVSLPVLDVLLDLTPGIILSGLGAAAGSGFWHDRLDNLRTAKEVSQTVEELRRQAAGGEAKA